MVNSYFGILDGRRLAHPMTDMAPNDERTVGEVHVPKVEMRQISDRSSLRSDAPQNSARHAAAPLQQIAEVLEAQEEAKAALEEAARDKKVRELSTCVSEFVSTEARYLADLQSVAVAFLEPLRPLLPPQLHYAIFSNLPQLQGLHQGLGTDLERATSETASDSGQASQTLPRHFRDSSTTVPRPPPTLVWRSPPSPPRPLRDSSETAPRPLRDSTRHFRGGALAQPLA